MVEINKGNMPNVSELPAAKIQAALNYQEYLKDLKHRPPLTGCLGPMTQEEFGNFQTNVVEPLKQLTELTNKAKNSR